MDGYESATTERRQDPGPLDRHEAAAGKDSASTNVVDKRYC